MKRFNHLGDANRVPLELKATINLPKTAFPMKANLPQNEPKALERWEQLRLYDRIRHARRGAPLYVLHDGPPYANGPIHLGTALNKCLISRFAARSVQTHWRIRTLGPALFHHDSAI